MLTSRKKFLPFALPSISEEAIEEVAQVLRSGWVTSGPKTKQFELEFAEYVSSPTALAVSSATAGLHLCLEAIGLTDTDAVLTTSVTFTATIEVVGYFGAEPVLCDVDPVFNNMSVDTLESAIQKYFDAKEGSLYTKSSGKRLRAIMPVHLAGLTCDMEGIIELCKKYELYCIEDAAHAFPAIHKSKMIGSWGDFTVFSFYATKGITTGEGGMITSPHSHLMDRIRKTRLHGINKDAFNRPGWYYEVTEPGFKYNLSDIQSALGIAQLREAQSFWDRRCSIATSYKKAFASIPGLRLPADDPMGKHSWHLFRIEVDPKIAKKGRDSLCEELKERNIGSSLHFIPIYEHPFYKRNYSFKKKDFPNANKMYDRSLSLPLFAGMSEEDVQDVIRAVQEILL